MVEANEAPAGVEKHADGVEADRVGAGTDVLGVGDPGHREPSQAGALARTQMDERLLIGATLARPHGHLAGLDLGEDQRVAVEGDQVDLAVAGAHVAPERREAETMQVGERELLSVPAQLMAGVRAMRIGGAVGVGVGASLGAIGGHGGKARRPDVTGGAQMQLLAHTYVTRDAHAGVRGPDGREGADEREARAPA